MSADSKIMEAFRSLMSAAGIPHTEFEPQFAERMCRAMMVSFHKYGRVADAYPAKFDAVADIRARLAEYRQSGNFWFLVDVANFAMIEAMHPRHELAHWGANDQTSSPGRVNAETRQLQQIDNSGGRIGGDTFLHIPREEER